MPSIHLLQYDIPEVRVTRASGGTYSRPVMSNPSARLWRAGAVRITLSCWLIHDGDLPNNLINDFRRHGVRWESVPFDPSAAESLARIAVQNIRKEIAEYTARARETAERELARLNTADKKEAAAAHRRYRSALAAIARRVRNVLKNVQVAAERFSITPEQIGVPDAQAALAGIKAGMEAKAATYVRAQNLIAKRNGAADPVARAMLADAIPGDIAADYIEEFESAEASHVAGQLRDAFGR